MLTHAELQHLRSLREKKQREAMGVFVIEGEKVIGELIAANFGFEKIYATSRWPQAAEANVAVEVVTESEMARVTHFPTPSSVLAVGRLQRHHLPAGELNRGLTLALDGVQDPGNVGTLLRIADWFALDRVVLSPDCADLFHQKVINASMGSFARVKSFSANLAEAFAHLSVPVLGCLLAGDNVHQLPLLHDAVVVIGSEGRGLSPAVEKLVTHRVTIPRFGVAESLNAAVAAAIVCDNLQRIRL